MNDQNLPQVRDVVSVGTRVSWGAICAGSILALALCVLMTTLGSAVGLSIHERFSATSLHTGSVIWAFLTVCTALFVGGLMTSLLTVGENKTEAVTHGILMWSLLMGIFLLLGATGIRGGLTLMSPSIGLTAIAREGVNPPSNLPDARRAVSGTPEKPSTDSRSVELNVDTARQLAWYSFAGTWLSMLAAAAGAFAGAGSTFRIAKVRPLTSSSARPV